MKVQKIACYNDSTFFLQFFAYCVDVVLESPIYQWGGIKTVDFGNCSLEEGDEISFRVQPTGALSKHGTPVQFEKNGAIALYTVTGTLLDYNIHYPKLVLGSRHLLTPVYLLLL